MKIPIPPLCAPVPLCETFRTICRTEARRHREGISTAAIRDALLAKLLSGEIRLPAAEKLVEEVA